MAVYTNVNNKDLKNFLRLYNIGNLLWCKGITEGVQNSNFIMKTDKKRFILTLYETRINENDLPFYLGLMNHLAKNGLKTAIPIKQNNGDLYSKLCGKPAAIIRLLKGVAIKNFNNYNLFQLGVTSAKFHKKAKTFNKVRINTLSQKNWLPLLKKCGTNINKIAPNIDNGLFKFLNTELIYLDKNWPKKLPDGIIHADLFPDNVLFTHSKLSGIIDLYFSCTEIYAYEIAIIINAWCFEKNGDLNLTKIKYFFKGYQSIRKLNQAELNATPILCRGAAMRFLLTRLYDWINFQKNALVIPKKPDEYIKHLSFHQKINHYSEYGIK